MTEDERVFGKIQFRGQVAYVREGFILNTEMDKLTETGLRIYGIRHDAHNCHKPTMIEPIVIAYHFGFMITESPLEMDVEIPESNTAFIVLLPDEVEDIQVAAGIIEGNMDPYTLEEITGISGWCNNG